jgi:hypothetical protein
VVCRIEKSNEDEAYNIQFPVIRDYNTVYVAVAVVHAVIQKVLSLAIK